MYKAEKFISDVISGKKNVPQTVIQACLRYENDIKIAKKKGWYFDFDSAKRVIDFFPDLLVHYKGSFAGKPIILEDWQQFIIWNIYGWKNSNGTRRFKYAYISVPRKNGKTTFMSGIGIYGLGFDNEPGAEIYTAATSREQAREVFDSAKTIVSSSAELSNFIENFQNSLFITELNSKFQPISKEARSKEGSNPHYGILDEYHLHPANDGIFKMIKSGMGTRRQPIVWIITTKGFNKYGVCYQYEKMCKSILLGQIEQDNIFAMIYEPDPVDNWEDKKVWKKVNPNYDFVSEIRTFLESEYIDAKNNKSMQVNFKTKNLNIWTDASDVWIKDEDWTACNLMEYPDFSGCIAYPALDLASGRDLTCFGILILKDGILHFLPFFFIPEENMIERVKRDNVNYDLWVQNGYIITTPGNVTDYNYIKNVIKEQIEKFNCKPIYFDRWNSSSLVNDLTSDGIEMNPFGQGFASMSSPTKELEKMILKKIINHAGNPVLRWMNSNVELKKDPAGNIKIDKGKSVEKVDGMVTLAMCIGNYLDNFENEPDLNEIYKNGLCIPK